MDLKWGKIMLALAAYSKSFVSMYSKLKNNGRSTKCIEHSYVVSNLVSHHCIGRGEGGEGEAGFQGYYINYLLIYGPCHHDSAVHANLLSTKNPMCMKKCDDHRGNH